MQFDHLHLKDHRVILHGFEDNHCTGMGLRMITVLVWV